MNGVFQSLRAQFELEETYTGRAVLGIVMNTIKVQPVIQTLKSGILSIEQMSITVALFLFCMMHSAVGSHGTHG